jgi:hypothetical protein
MGIEPASSAWDGPVSPARIPARIPGTWQSAVSGGGGSRSPARRVGHRQEQPERTRDELQRVRDALTDAGVTGVEDFGRFLNNTASFRPSRFDERAVSVAISICPVTANAVPDCGQDDCPLADGSLRSVRAAAGVSVRGIKSFCSLSAGS